MLITWNEMLNAIILKDVIYGIFQWPAISLINHCSFPILCLQLSLGSGDVDINLKCDKQWIGVDDILANPESHSTKTLKGEQ